MKKRLCFIFYFLLIIKCYSQNLITNPSFEDTNPTNFWSTSMGICFNSPVNICYKTDNYNDVNHIGFNAYDGKNCAYLSLFQCKTQWSDYLINKITRLEKGKKYEISFFITPSDSCRYYAQDIDLIFCNSNSLSKNISCLTPGKIFMEPTLSFDISTFKKTGQEGAWIKFSNTFIASGGEDLMVVGGFFKEGKRRNNFTRTFNYRPTKRVLQNFCGADYYLDSFSLVEKKQ